MATEEKKKSLDTDIDIYDISGEVELAIPEGLTKDLKKEIKNMKNASRQEIKFLLDSYYQTQKMRIAVKNQIDAIKRSADDNADTYCDILTWRLKCLLVEEDGIVKALDTVCKLNPVGKWLTQILGISSILAAGCLSYFELKDNMYATHFISYAGLNDNNRPWLGSEKAKKIVNEVLGDSKEITDEHLAELSIRTQWKYGYLNEHCTKVSKSGKVTRNKQDLINAIAKIPYNKSLKVLMYKIAHSFKLCCNKPNSLYGRLYQERKILETKLNEEGKYADQAKEILATKNFNKNTEAYKYYSQGKLPPAHIQRRAERYATKIFVVHLFEEMYREKYGEAPAPYYVFKLGHKDYIEPEVPFTK